MLATVNVWMDIITAILAAAIVLGFVVPHLIGSVLTGRVRKHFVMTTGIRWHTGLTTAVHTATVIPALMISPRCPYEIGIQRII